MISEFGDDPRFKMRMTGILGLVVTLGNLGMSLYMIITCVWIKCFSNSTKRLVISTLG